MAYVPKNRTWTTKICEFCGKEFKAYQSNKKYCNDKCRYGAWEKDNPRVKKR